MSPALLVPAAAQTVVTPQNGAYYHAAYAATAGIYLLYAASLWRRLARARRAADGGPAAGER